MNNAEILLYHRVVDCVPDNQYLSVSPDHFEDHLALLSAHRKVLPLHDLVRLAAKGRLVNNGVAITFDDGYADNLINALPLLEKYKCHATVFVTARMLGHPHGFWYDVLEDVLLIAKNVPESVRIDCLDAVFPLRTAEERLASHEALFGVCKAAPLRVVRLLLHELLTNLGYDSAHYASPHPLLTNAQLIELAASPWIEIGSHTLTHPVLSELSETAQRQEIVLSRKVIEDIINKPIRLFAYPYGNSEAFNETTCRLTAEAGLYGIANVQGPLTLPFDPVRIPRRLVRNWQGRVFKRWLQDTNKGQIETQTTGPRLNMLFDYLKRSEPVSGRVCLRRPDAVLPTVSPLSITHVNTLVGKGGASRVTTMLATMQEAMGHVARILTASSLVDDPLVALFSPAISSQRTALAEAEGLLDYALQGSHALPRHPAFQKAQVVHYHNLHGGFFNPWSLVGLSRLRPSVWTLHDMQALTGHCAHAFACTRWHDGCGLCPDLQGYPSVAVDNTHRLWRDKRCIYASSPVHVVTPSQWLAEHVRRSSLAEHPLTVIPNGIDTQVFTPRDKLAARMRLGIPQDALVIGSAAHDGPLHNAWKGGGFALETLRALRECHTNMLFLGRGNVESTGNDLVRLLPYAHSEDDMADFYATLDLMLYPSLADNCPLVILEAMACGVPVVAFTVGGIPELVDDGATGLTVPARDGIALTQATFRLVEDATLRERMAKAARLKAERAYDMRLMAQRYDQLYETVLSEWRNRLESLPRLDKRDMPSLIATSRFRELAREADLMVSDRELYSGSTRAAPLSRVFGLDRGQPIDRVFIERFLLQNAQHIRGRVLEVADSTYTRRFGTGVTQSDVLHAEPSQEATLVGDLATGESIPIGAFDCVILTQTLQFIYDTKSALRSALLALRPGGVLLLTTAGISQISRYDMERWGDYWRFTDKALRALCTELVPGWEVDVVTFGNAGLAKAFLDGQAAQELPEALFTVHDADYQLVVCACVRCPNK